MLKKIIMISALAMSLALILTACGAATPPESAAPADQPTEEAVATEPAEQPAAEAVVTEQPAEAAAPEESAVPAVEADLAAVKAYALEHAQQMKAATEAFRQSAETYHSRIAHAKEEHPGEDPYEHIAAEHREEIAELLAIAKEQWIEASTHYELDEGIVAGVPSLAFYDIWIDAGPPAADAPDEALPWQLVLADGRTLDSPGNFFHNLTEPALYGTNEEFVALETDLDGDGAVELGEVMPEAELFLASAQGLDQAAGDMLAALEAWEPTLKDTFGALVIMTPTMNEYFEQWKLSAFVSGENFEEKSFVALSRLFDINGILNGLNVAYENISPVVATADADLDAQISSGYEDLVAYVGDLYEQEQGGKVFTPEEADLFGTEAQDKATALSGQVAQAAALAGVELTEEEPAIPTEPIVITAQAPAAAGFEGEEAAAPAGEATSGADLAAVKAYALDNAQKMKAGTEAFEANAEQYYSLIASEDFDYEAAWTNHQEELTGLIEEARANWIEASTYYEIDEGIVAGVPSLAFYDIWIDAGPSAAEAPDEALAWQLVLPDGQTLDSPGNFFHGLSEPTLYGTVDEFTGLKVDLDGDGTIELGEALPEANMLLATAQGLDQATGEMQAALEAWEPTLEDTFGALVTMIPTMNEYFEQWKLSAFVSGENAEEVSFIALSRLFDINGILTGLNVAYDNISPVVAEADADLDTQIQSGFEDLVGYVGDLYEQEQSGIVFSAEEADLFGTEAQDKATALAGQVAQAAALAEVELSEEEPVIPETPIIITALAPEASAAPMDSGATEASGTLVIYSGRSESLVGPLIEQFEQESGIEVEVRYGDTAEMAATILEEGGNSPADLYYGQDAGALGALAKAGRLAQLPEDLLTQVEPRFRSPEGQWIGTSGRARVLVYNPEQVSEAELPEDIFGLCAPEWKGRVGWAPTNGSFQAFITALRVLEGEERAREWLTCMQANEPVVFPNNAAQVEAVAAGEIDAGLVNHYYLYQFLAEDPDFPARNYHLSSGDAGAIINIAGAGILDTAANPAAAEAFIRYMLSEAGQTYFNTQTHEYPLSADIEVNPLLIPLEEIQTPEIDLSDLDDLEGTLTLLQELGIL